MSMTDTVIDDATKKNGMADLVVYIFSAREKSRTLEAIHPAGCDATREFYSHVMRTFLLMFQVVQVEH